MAAVQPETCPINRNPELFVIGAMAFQIFPRTGSERDAIPIVYIAARQFSRQRIQARIVLGSFDKVVLDDIRIARQKIVIVQHLVIRRFP